VGEVNFGGAMVGFVIRQARPHTPYRAITASRGKTVRAEPVSALMEEGKVRIVGVMRELEDELLGFTTHGYIGERSPNRADAAIWAISDLFPELMKAQDQDKKERKAPLSRGRRGSGAWMNSL
jgi:phage terminase large subunit-like protein